MITKCEFDLLLRGQLRVENPEVHRMAVHQHLQLQDGRMIQPIRYGNSSATRAQLAGHFFPNPYTTVLAADGMSRTRYSIVEDERNEPVTPSTGQHVHSPQHMHTIL